ncbi:MAG: cell division protein SepF [Actinomycetota bacterium]|nr:cell division protein SepF [Actinomycetota bacterium]
MSSLFSKALVYLGLVDEDQIDVEVGEQMGAAAPEAPNFRNGVESVPEGRRVEPPPTSRAATRPQGRTVQPTHSVAGVRPVEVQSDILVVEEFSDARTLADRVRDRTPVVLDMRQADPDLVRRVVDFSSGLIYALDGSMRRVGDGLVAVLPPRVTLSRDEKRRLSSLGAYELDDIE